MAQIMNFKKLEVTGTTKEEALAKAPFNTNLPGADCTQALRNYKKAHASEAFTDAAMRQFMLEQLEKKTRNTVGNGCYIVVESAVTDTRERPYTKHDVKNEQGSRKWTKVFQIFENLGTAEKPRRGELIVEAAGNTKSEASNKAKELYTKMGLRKNIVCYYTKQVTEGEPIAFTMDYTPSKNAKQGVYLVFGIEA